MRRKKSWFSCVEVACALLVGCTSAEPSAPSVTAMSSQVAPHAAGSSAVSAAHAMNGASGSPAAVSGSAARPSQASAVGMGGAGAAAMNVSAAAAGNMATGQMSNMMTAAGVGAPLGGSAGAAGHAAAAQADAGHAAGSGASPGSVAGAGAAGMAASMAGGDACTDYCEGMAMACEGDNLQYPDQAACMSACAGFDKNGTPGTMRGNTLQCRRAHIDNVLKRGDPPAIHCNHAGPSGGGACS